jgi:hypothetical protein
MLNPAKVVHEIEILEGANRSSLLKAPTQFKHAPLKGLWHKHYLEDGMPSFARNLRKGIERFGIPFVEQQVAQAKASGQEKYLSEQDCARIAHDAVVGNWERLVHASALTGEWIVYAEWQGQNYYLCLGTHESGDNNLRSQIDEVCLAEFPFLRLLLPPHEP